MTTNELLDLKASLTAKADQSSANLAKACAAHKGIMGLITDEYRATDEYASLSNLYAFDKSQLATFWKMVRGNKEFKKANYEAIMAKRYNKVDK